MEKKKAIFTFALTMLGTIAGNCLFHYFKDRKTAQQREQELEDFCGNEPLPSVEAEQEEASVPKKDTWEFLDRLDKVPESDNADYEPVTVPRTVTDIPAVQDTVNSNEAYEERTEPIESVLSENEQTVLELHEMFGGSMTTKQIAEHTGMGRSTVDRLKKKLIEKGYNTAEGKKLKNVTINWNEADKLILDGKKNSEISKILHCDNSTISKRRKTLRESGRLSA